MSVSLRAVGLAAVLLAASASPAAAQSEPPPTLAGTDLSTPPAGDPGGAIVSASRCSPTSGFAAFTATGTAVNGSYAGPFAEGATARLGAGGLSPDFEQRPLEAATHTVSIQSPYGMVFGTQRTADVPDGGICVKPVNETTRLYLNYGANTRYAARIETPGGVYVDRGAGSFGVDITETFDGTATANTQTLFEFSDAEGTQLLRRRDCRRGGFAELAYATKRECRRAARANRDF